MDDHNKDNVVWAEKQSSSMRNLTVFMRLLRFGRDPVQLPDDDPVLGNQGSLVSCGE